MLKKHTAYRQYALIMWGKWNNVHEYGRLITHVKDWFNVPDHVRLIQRGNVDFASSHGEVRPEEHQHRLVGDNRPRPYLNVAQKETRRELNRELLVPRMYQN